MPIQTAKFGPFPLTFPPWLSQFFNAYLDLTRRRADNGGMGKPTMTMNVSFRAVAALVISALVLGCGFHINSAAPPPPVVHYKLARAVESDGREHLNMNFTQTISSNDPKAPGLHQGIMGGSDTSDGEERTLSWLCRDVQKEAETQGNTVTVWMPLMDRKEAHRAYLVASLKGLTVELDGFEGVEHVKFDDKKVKAWPLVLTTDGYALDISFTDGGKTAHINRVLHHHWDSTGGTAGN